MMRIISRLSIPGSLQYSVADFNSLVRLRKDLILLKHKGLRNRSVAFASIHTLWELVARDSVSKVCYKSLKFADFGKTIIMSSSPLAVAVVGAGAAGLCAARHLASNPQVFSIWFKVCAFITCWPFCPFCGSSYLSQLRPTVIEQSKVIGGTWVYSPNTGDDEHGLPRSISYWTDSFRTPTDL